MLRKKEMEKEGDGEVEDGRRGEDGRRCDSDKTGNMI